MRVAFVRTAIYAVFLFVFVGPMPGQTSPAGGGSPSSLWSDVSEQTITAGQSSTRSGGHRRDIVPRNYRTLQIDKSALNTLLAAAVPETAGPIETNGIEFDIPHPRGGFHRFLIQESPIMEPKLAARFPELKTYLGRSVDDPATTLRMDITPRGFHAIILSPNEQIYVDPYSRDDDINYISYSKSDFTANKASSCEVDSQGLTSAAVSPATTASRSSDGTLRVYRLALACTGEYAAAVCSPNAPTVNGTLSAMITSINRASAIYERELAIRFVLVANNDKLVYLDGNTDPYTNTSGSTMLSQNQSNIDSVIGSGNYDFGHVFSTGGGGIASIAVVCANGSKARGVTGTPNPVGDPYDVDFVVHEMGHQFGADHSFDGTGGSCGGNGNAGTAYEPGSGSTIMSYSGICGAQSLGAHSDDYFHTISYDEIMNFVSSVVGACAQTSATGNTAPTIAALPSGYTIPAKTPFALTANATDPNGDVVTYCWEEFDLGPFQDPTADPRDNGSSPLFRSFPPTTNPTRTFPSLTYILNNQNVPPAVSANYATAEYLPTTSRTMTFRVTARDNRTGGGGVSYSSTNVTSVSSAGPFVVTSHNSGGTITGGSQQTVTWNVAGTNLSPINCGNVKISLSTDGGNTFQYILANSVPNNGSAVVTIPNVANVGTNQGRIKVESVGNIFFDVSDANLTIISSNTAPVVNISSNITVARGSIAPVVTAIGTASDANGNALTVSVSDMPFGTHVTPSISNGTIYLSATADCRVVTTLSLRAYPITITVTDSYGSTASAKANLVITPNPSPTLGQYADMNVSRNSVVSNRPSAPPADANGNLGAAPFSISPGALPSGGTLTIDQSSGVVTAAPTNATNLGTVPVRVTLADTCGAVAITTFNIYITACSNCSPQAPVITNGPPPTAVVANSPYSFTFTASGNPTPSFSLRSGTLPPGLSFASTGVLSGTVNTAGSTYPNIVVAADNGNQPSAQQTFSLTTVTRASSYLGGFGLTGTNAGLLYDYDHDGIVNLAEYALGLNPTVANLSGLPAVSLKNYSGTNYLSMIFHRSSAATDLTYAVQVSTDLVNWTDLARSTGGAQTTGSGFVTETGTAPNYTVEVRDTTPFTGTAGVRRFLRLKISTP